VWRRILKLINLNELDNRFSELSAFYPNIGYVYDYAKELNLNYIYSNLDKLNRGKCKVVFSILKSSFLMIIEKFRPTN